MSNESANQENPFAQGRLIGGKYRIERILAAGGSGVVLLATHVALGHRVAIKHLHAHLVRDRVFVERFKREARLAASLRSNHVVRVHDVGELPGGVPYMVMEYLEGEDLGAVSARGRTDIGVALGWVIQVCDALAEAHALGIVHRDLKPENLFLVRGGSGSDPVVKVVDFGISKVETGLRTLEGARLPRMTADNERFGTPIYMSPEQLASCANVDARADIWALGVVLHELITSDIPFEGNDLPAVIASILTGSPRPLRRDRPDASTDLEALVLACLSRDPSRRPPSAAALANALRELGQALDAGSTPACNEIATRAGVLPTPDLAWTPMALGHPTRPLPPRPGRSLAVAAVAATLAIAAAVVPLLAKRSVDAGFVPAPVQAAAVTVATIDAGPVVYPHVVNAPPPLPSAEPAPPRRKAKARPAPRPQPSTAPAPRPPAPVVPSDYSDFGGRK